MKLLIMNKD